MTTTTPSELAAVQFVDLAGYRMAYREWGTPTDRPPLVLVHGITSSSLSWVRVAPRLAQRTRVIAVDLKGHGDSDQPASGYRIADQAAEVVGLCQALGLERIDLIGHSWGGGIALQVATDGRLPIRRLVLEDPGLGQTSTSPEQLEARRTAQAGYIGSVGLTPAEADAKFRPNLALGWTEHDLAGKIDAAVKGSPVAVERVFTENGDRNQIPLLAQLRCPTLLVRAEVARGGIVGDEAVAVARTNPLITLVTIPEADHNIHRGRFDAFMREVEAFLSQL
jgi:pimeloyl-ACP methyl ester carboxylesterase